MQNSTVLLLIDQETPDDAISGFAEASVPTNLHLSYLALGLPPELPLAGFGLPPYGTISVPEDWVERLEAEHQRETQRMQRIEQVLARAGVSGDAQSAFCVLNEIRNRVALRARVSDIAYVAQNLRDPALFREAASGVLFGAPIGLVLNCAAPLKPQTIFIAWDGSKAASDAVHAALPMLTAAGEIVIGTFDPVGASSADGPNPGSGLAAWLSHHGCQVTVNQYPSGGKDIGTCIHDRAQEVGAELVVMGAYGHSRTLQAVFGGTTRLMMEQADLPVFFAH